jgi:hypothetical protein
MPMILRIVLAAGALLLFAPPAVSAAEPPGPRAQRLDCGNGLRLMMRDEAWGIVDADGQDVIAPRYRALSCFNFKYGFAWAPIEAKRQWCPIGSNGALRDEPACRTDYYPVLGSDASPEQLDPDPYENSVRWTRGYLDFGLGRQATEPRLIGVGHLTQNPASLELIPFLSSILLPWDHLVADGWPASAVARIPRRR